MHTKLTTAARTLLVAGAILLPALLNGRPFLFEDSLVYFSIGRNLVAAASKLIYGGTDAPREARAPGSAGGAGKPSLHPTNGPGDGLTTLAGARSPVYSLLVYIASANLSTWAVAVIQAVLVAWLLVSFLSAAWGTKKALPVFMVALLLSIFSSLGFMAAFVMPDIFCAVMVLASARRAAEPDMSGPEKLVLSGLVIVSAFMHSSNLALLGLMLVAAWALRWLSPRSRAPASRLIPTLAVAVVAGVTLKFAYAAAVTRVTGQPLGSPPFLMARIIADGPGARYLTEACANDPKSFRVCELSAEEYRDHDDFIWGSHGAKRSFTTLPRQLKTELGREEPWFVLAVAQRYPREVLVAAMRNFVAQLAAVGIKEASFDAERLRATAWADLSIVGATPEFDICRSFGLTCPARRTTVLIWRQAASAFNVVAFLGLATLLLWQLTPWRLGDTFGEDGVWRELGVTASVIGFALIANAAVCGIASGANDRYQARIVWLAALIVLACAGALRSMRREPASA